MSFFHAFLCCLGGCGGCAGCREFEESDNECDDITSFSGEIPPFEVKTESTTVVRYVNEDNFMAISQTVVETTHIDPQADCDSGQDMETKDSTPDNASDARTLVEDPETAIVPSASSFQSDERSVIEKDTEIVLPCPTFVDRDTGRRMVELLYVTSMCLFPIVVCLDDCEICEPSKPESGEDEIEALFRYNDIKFPAYVPAGYVKARRNGSCCVD